MLTYALCGKPARSLYAQPGERAVNGWCAECYWRPPITTITKEGAGDTQDIPRTPLYPTD